MATTPRKKKQSTPRKRAAAADTNGEAEKSDVPAANGAAPKRRSTAQAMAANQKEISVSEFFAKNRHLLGFDNPRKALLTTVKEAVDNSLDACEEAGILPEIWVHIESTGSNRYKVGIQDNGPGILKKQIPLIFGKLLYGSKFHRLRQSRGQQGIGISAAGMYGVQTTGKPVKIISKVGPKQPAHYYEIQIDTKTRLFRNSHRAIFDVRPVENQQLVHPVAFPGDRFAGDKVANGPGPLARCPGVELTARVVRRHRQPPHLGHVRDPLVLQKTAAVAQIRVQDIASLVDNEVGKLLPPPQVLTRTDWHRRTRGQPFPTLRIVHDHRVFEPQGLDGCHSLRNLDGGAYIIFPMAVDHDVMVPTECLAAVGKALFDPP